MTNTLVIILLLLFIYYSNYTNGEKLDESNQEEFDDADGFYKNETPANWVDALFAFLMMIHHTYYAYKFTDYSLSHIHSYSEEKEAKKNEKEEKKKLKQELKGKKKKKKKKKGYKKRNGDNNSPLPTTSKPEFQKLAEEKRKRRAAKKQKKAEKEMKKAAMSKNFTTKSSSRSKRRSMSNKFCCCIKCAPKYFTWQRTAIIRLFLRLYTSISCLLGMVLYMEIFMNLLVEFVITCIVHYKQGYFIALLLIPLLLYVIETLLRLSWHSVYVSWQINCDSNGDFEAIESEGNHHFNFQGDRFLYSYKMDAGDIEDQYNSSDYLSTSDDSDSFSSTDDEFDDIESDNDYDDDTNDNGSIAKWSLVNSWSKVSNNNDNKKTDITDLGTQYIFSCFWIVIFWIVSIHTDNLGVIQEEESALLVLEDKSSKKSKQRSSKQRSSSDIAELTLKNNSSVKSTKSSKSSKKDKKKRAGSDLTKLKQSLSLNDKKNEKEKAKDIDSTKLKEDGFVILDEDDKKGKGRGKGKDKDKKQKKIRAMTEDDIELRREKGKESVEKDKEDLVTKRKLEKEKEDRKKEKEEQRKEREALRLKLQKHKDAAKARRKEARKLQREQMGDYFVATCWRFWFCFGTFVAAVVASSTVEEIGVNALFWQFVMRYCIVGGLLWTLTYYLYALMLSIMSRMMSWTLLHPNINRCKFFCLVDAKDHEKKNKAWRNCKVLTMITSLSLFIICLITGFTMMFVIENDAAGFVIFIGFIFILYYCTNIFMSCKPFGLIALWTDTIPPPGKNYFAHQLVNAKLQDAGTVDNDLTIKGYSPSNQIGIGTNTNLEMTTTTTTTRTRHTLSNEDINNLATRTGVSAYLPNLGGPEKLNITKSHQEFVAERVTALIKRYKKFRYIYKDPETQLKKKGKETDCIGANITFERFQLFWNNYKNYWLNVYRPFDEYDMESNLAASNILYGFQWVKPCLECRCARKKSTKGKLGKMCTYLLDNTCNLCLILFFAGIIGVLFWFASFQSAQDQAASVLFQESVNATDQVQFYPVCSEYFGDEVYNIDLTQQGESSQSRSDVDLSVLDVLFLTQIVYEMDKFNITEILNGYFEDEFKLISIQYDVPFYFHIKHRSPNVNIDYVSIRGTANKEEILQDISLFVEVGLFEQLQSIVPFLNALPQSFVTRFIYYASLFESLINADVRDRFDEPIYIYLEDYLLNITTSLHIVGHSLGGAISQIVAANLFEDGYDSYISSFGVCSPGTLLSSAKFNFGAQALDKTSRSLLPRRDPVSMVDQHGGSIAYIDCDADTMFGCHVTPTVICEVYNNCPNQLARKPQIFECFCNSNLYPDIYPKQQFAYCLNATQCQGQDCYVTVN